MTGHIYRDVILEQHVRLFRAPWVLNFCLWMQRPSSPCKHCRRMPSIGEYHPYGLASILTGLESNRACVGYAWPTNCSPSPPPTCLPELRRALLDEWCNIPQDQIDNLILSMPRRSKREKIVDDSLIYTKSLCEELEISFESPIRIRRKYIFGDGSKDVQLSYEDDLRRTIFSSIDRVTAEILERFQQLQNVAQKYAFLRPEVILSMDKLNLDQAPQDINKEFQLEREHRQAFVAATYPHCKKELISCQVIYSQIGLAIHQNDPQARRRFVEWAQNEIAVVPDFHKRILFSDEAHFWLNGYVNKQNCRIWSEANPQVYVETPLHPEKLTVWCALWAGGILQKR
ncbi:uncharacterized protein TNCV_1126191 [Trichonephila clavipes]|nr:uncharacterized protein TNCV_1126191 [Trichonephila clavipes]